MSYDTDIDISNFKVIDEKTLNDINEEFYSKYREIPEEFNWSYILKGDNQEIIQKKKLISKVKNQHLCGCCWAIACATSISDCFVVKNLVNWSPNVSYTYALSKYPQQKCLGGSSRILLEDIKNGEGIASDNCVDDSWCVNNENCVNGDASKHFSYKNKEFLSSLIPNEGCYDGTKNHFLYKISDVYSLTVSNNLKISEAQKKIKQHIMVRGPVVAGFLIMDNFPDGEFTKKGNGIYFEKEYNDKIYNIDINSNILGSHSVVIMGWGISKNQKYNNLIVDIPYWFCRNSWGDTWGDRGFFKIAMFPFNKVCQFSKRIRVLHENSIKEVGGVTGFNVIEPPNLKKIKSNNVILKHIRNNLNFLTDENLVVNNNFLNSFKNNYKINDKNTNKEEFFVVIIVFFFTIYYILQI